MSSLQQLLVGTSTNPSVTTVVQTNPIIEPIDGPTSVDDVFDRFPPEVYQQGKDSHLYRFLTALIGDSGAGLVKKLSYSARLQWEAEFMNFVTLDNYYASQFQINRLQDETYDPSANIEALTSEQWDAIQLADQQYRFRVMEFFTALRSGNSPAGLAMMAQAGSGLDADLIEHYKYLFDQYSDDPLGLEPFGTTLSTAEFVILSRFIGADSSKEWTAPWSWDYVFTPPTLTTNVGRPIPLPAGGNVMSVARTYSGEASVELVPEVERNVIDLLDRLRSVNTLSTLNPVDTPYMSIPVSNIAASSERIEINRFVTGRTDVAWPSVDSTQGYFIQSGVENEATSWYGTAPELPVVFLTIQSVVAYTERALADPTYLDYSFHIGDPAPIVSYASEQYGVFLQTLISIFPFLSQVAVDQQFLAVNAIAIQETPLILQGNTNV